MIINIEEQEEQGQSSKESDQEAVWMFVCCQGSNYQNIEHLKVQYTLGYRDWLSQRQTDKL